MAIYLYMRKYFDSKNYMMTLVLNFKLVIEENKIKVLKNSLSIDKISPPIYYQGTNGLSLTLGPPLK